MSKHYETLNKMGLDQTGDKIGKMDTSQKLHKVVKSLKTIRFKASNTVAREVDKLVILKTTSEATRGPLTTFDIIEDCTVSCKLQVKDRKGPFKIYIGYNEANNKS